jgi:hypothetical protein
MIAAARDLLGQDRAAQQQDRTPEIARLDCGREPGLGSILIR